MKIKWVNTFESRIVPDISSEFPIKLAIIINLLLFYKWGNKSQERKWISQFKLMTSGKV